MEANKILNADILDIIFEGKNKSYGAYELRKTYNDRITKALIATGIVLLLVLGGILLSPKAEAKKKDIETKDASLAEIKKDVPPPPVVPPPPPPPPPPPAIKSIQFTPPIVKKDIEIVKPKEIEEIKDDAAIAEVTNKVDNTEQKVKEIVQEVKESQVAEAPVKAVEEDKIFQKVEIESQFPGGPGAFANYLRKNLNANTPSENNASPGRYTVIVRFVVMKDGSVSDVVAETDPGFGCAAEAVKVIKKSQRWTPGIQNGTNVSSIKRQPITFEVAEE